MLLIQSILFKLIVRGSVGSVSFTMIWSNEPSVIVTKSTTSDTLIFTVFVTDDTGVTPNDNAEPIVVLINFSTVI